MKKLFKIQHVLVLCTFFFVFSCTEDDTSLDTGATKSSEITRPYGLITPEQMQELNTNWNKTRAQVIQTNLGIEDNQSVKFSLDELRNYLDYAERQAEELGYQMDGVRIYFGAYGQNDASESAGLATVFFAPTGYQVKPNEASFFNFFRQEIGGDVPGGSGLNRGQQGEPPGSNYPQ